MWTGSGEYAVTTWSAGCYSQQPTGLVLNRDLPMNWITSLTELTSPARISTSTICNPSISAFLFALSF